MTIQEVTRLLDAGFSKDEIIAFVHDPEASKEQEREQSQDQNQEHEKEQEGEQSQDQNQEQEKEQSLEKEKPADDTEKRLSSIEASINSLVKAIQKQNLRTDHIDSNDETLEQQTDDIMKSIIRPEHNRKDDK